MRREHFGRRLRWLACLLRRQQAQTTVELLAAVPVIVLCGVIGLQALAVGVNAVYADNAARAAASAVVLGRNPRAAALAALPGWGRGRVTVRRSNGSVFVWLRPRAVVPPIAALLGSRGAAAFEGDGRGRRSQPPGRRTANTKTVVR